MFWCKVYNAIYITRFTAVTVVHLLYRRYGCVTRQYADAVAVGRALVEAMPAEGVQRWRAARLHVSPCRNTKTCLAFRSQLIFWCQMLLNLSLIQGTPVFCLRVFVNTIVRLIGLQGVRVCITCFRYLHWGALPRLAGVRVEESGSGSRRGTLVFTTRLHLELQRRCALSPFHS